MNEKHKAYKNLTKRLKNNKVTKLKRSKWDKRKNTTLKCVGSSAVREKDCTIYTTKSFIVGSNNGS